MQSAHTHSWKNRTSNQPAIPELLTTQEVAELLNVSKRSVIRWRNERIGPPWCKLGRNIRYRRESLEHWIAESEQQSVAEVAQ